MSLSPNAELWLRTGERCAAVETIFTYCTGVNVVSDHGEDVPRTMEDLRRCRLLFEMCPELRSCLPRVGNLSAAWAEIVSFWDDLTLLQEIEDPDWQDQAGKAPKTQEMLDTFTSRDPA